MFSQVLTEIGAQNLQRKLFNTSLSVQGVWSNLCTPAIVFCNSHAVYSCCYSASQLQEKTLCRAARRGCKTSPFMLRLQLRNLFRARNLQHLVLIGIARSVVCRGRTFRQFIFYVQKKVTILLGQKIRFAHYDRRRTGTLALNSSIYVGARGVE